MDQLLLAKNILQHRQQAKITQEQLAHILGVTKAAVSKWETGQSLPDILILPRLATYFNVSIDDLMGYSRQLSATQIQKLYKSLTEKFASGAIDEALDCCKTCIHDYYHCYPLLVKVCGLYVNHLDIITDSSLKAHIVQTTIDLCQHILKHSDNINVLQEAKTLLTITYLMDQQPELALEQIGTEEKLLVPDSTLRAQCYSLLGQTEKAEKSLQISIYQSLLFLVQSLIDYMSLQMQHETLFEETYHRANAIIEAFELQQLHPFTTIRSHYGAAICYVQLGKNDLALNCLKRYVKEIKTYLYPMQLRGDDFFTHILDWFKDMDISVDAPRDPLIIKQSLIQSLEHPVLQVLQALPDFKQLQHELTQLNINEEVLL